MSFVRRIIFSGLVVFLLSSPFLGYCQLRGGIKAGPQISDVIITNKPLDATGSYSSLVGYHIGSFVENKFTNSFGWKAEAMFSAKGYSYEMDDDKDNIHLNYLTWPLMIVYFLNEDIEIETGLEPGFMISGEEEFRGFDLGINFGLQFRLKERIFAGIRYSQGLPFGMKSTGIGNSNELPNYQQAVIQLSLLYNFLRERNEE